MFQRLSQNAIFKQRKSNASTKFRTSHFEHSLDTCSDETLVIRTVNAIIFLRYLKFLKH